MSEVGHGGLIALAGDFWDKLSSIASGLVTRGDEIEEHGDVPKDVISALSDLGRCRSACREPWMGSDVRRSQRPPIVRRGARLTRGCRRARRDEVESIDGAFRVVDDPEVLVATTLLQADAAPPGRLSTRSRRHDHRSAFEAAVVELLVGDHGVVEGETLNVGLDAA
jgi:hypothetical protein